MTINASVLYDGEDARQRGLTVDEREQIRRKAICSVFQKTDRILLGTLEIDVQAVQNADMGPGWTTGREIFLNFEHIEGRTDRDLIAMWGLNYHELAHIILTPRIKQELRRLVRDQYFGTGLNIAEDWRIETQFSALFLDAQRYFHISFADLIVNRPDANEGDIYALAAGRLYLSAASRERWRRKFAEARDGVEIGTMMPQELRDGIGAKHPDLWSLSGDDWANRLRSVAEEYATLAWAREAPDARDRNRHLVSLAEQVAILTLTPPQDGGGGGGKNDWRLFGSPDADGDEPLGTGGKLFGRDMPSKGGFDEKMSEVAAQAAMEVRARSEAEAQKIEEAIKKAGVDAQVANSPKQQSEANEKKGQGKDKSESSPEGESNADAKPSDKVIVDPNQGVHEGGVGSAANAQATVSASAGRNTSWEGKASRTAQLTDEQRELMERLFADSKVHDELLTEEADALASHRQIQRNLKSIRRSVMDAMGSGVNLEALGVAERVPAPSKIRGERNRLARYLRDVRSQLEGAYLDGQASGKVHLRSWVNASVAQKPHSFRAWLPDEVDEMGLEVVGLIDRSSSMNGIMDHASQVTWSIASAIQQTEGKVTLIGFADPGKEEVLLGRDSKINDSHYDSYGTYGGTHIAEALSLARQVLAASDQPNKLLYIVTDGGWADTHEALQEIRKINADQVDTLLVLLGMHMEREHRGCKYVVQANDVSAMGRALASIVRRISQNAARRVALGRGVNL